MSKEKKKEKKDEKRKDKDRNFVTGDNNETVAIWSFVNGG